MFRLAALGVSIQEDAARLSAKLRLSSQETNHMLSLAAASAIVQPLMRELKAALYRLGPRLCLGRLLLAWASADASANAAAWTSGVDLLGSWQRPKFPIGGADLIARGWSSGAALGDQLRRLEEESIASGFLLSRGDLLQRGWPPIGGHRRVNIDGLSHRRYMHQRLLPMGMRASFHPILSFDRGSPDRERNL